MTLRSLWAATASPPPPTSPLEESRKTDVAIVGGGYTGLSTALRLAKGGAEVVLMDAGEPGGAASGLNGGQVNPGLKQDPDEILAIYGAEAGERLVEFAGKTADRVFALIDEHGISCDASRAGWLQPAHSPGAVEVLERRVSQWQRRGAPLELLDRATTAELLGTDRYFRASLDRRAGSLHPLSYARGLARAAIEKGASIFGETRAVAIERGEEGIRITTARGPSVVAARVFLATNGYTDGLWPRLRETVIAANSFQVATSPLPESLGRPILPRGHVASDTRELLRYFRRDRTGRLLMGGRGPFREPAGPSDFTHLKKAVVDLFPALEGIDYEFWWSGRVALTRDYLPHFHEPAPGILAFLGCNGRGVGLGTAMGEALAEHLLHPGRAPLPFPITGIRPIPFHGLKRFYVAAVISYHRLRDAL
ncbi:MAG: NAD(P)/FAD-dependent oxidoreductase [Vicinamibacteria bacterium]